ncbi:hypothetical protein C8J56DRAFT_261490 [Mycena floridula]|nr:hypothetical protein C8J56DRAFT_261490 [Mycena floridula]
MFPPSLGHTLNGNTFGDTQGDFLSNNKTRISIRVGCSGKRTRKACSKPSAAPLREFPRIPIAHINELNFVRSRIYGSDLVAGDGFHIHAAKYQGKVVAVKVYQGMDSAKRLEADLNLASSLIHPTMLRPVAVFTATATPFIVLGGDSSPMIPSSLGGFKSLRCCLADALDNSEVESLMLGAQLLRDVSSGLDYISNIQQTIGVSQLTFDLLVDENDNICITVGVGEEDETGDQGYLEVFHNLCSKSFLEANNECHSDKSQTPTTNKSASGSSSQRDLKFSPAEDEPIAETDLQSDCLPTPARREYAFVPDRSHQSLREISTSYARFMRSITKKIQHFRRKSHGNSTIVAHRCPGYRRDEVTLGTSVLRTAIIQHLTPSPREICPVCKQLVEDGTFNCFCGQGDDGRSSTIQCSWCRVWSHRTCQVNGDSMGDLPFTCASCSRPRSRPPSPPPSLPPPPPRVSRPELAAYAQRHRMSIEYPSWNTGTKSPPSWVSAVFL